MFDVELRRQKALFALADQAALAGALALALAVHDHSQTIAGKIHTELPQVDLALVGVAVGWFLVFRAFDLYRLRNGGLEALAVIKACTVSMALILLFGFGVHIQLSRLAILIALPLSVGLVIASRAAVRRAVHRIYADPKIAIPLLVIGFNPLARYLCDHILEELTQYELLGFIADGSGVYRGYEVLGGIEQIGPAAARWSNLEVVIVAPDDHTQAAFLERTVAACKDHRVRWRIVPPLFGALWGELQVDMIGMVPLVGPRCSNIEGLNFIIKRGFDLVVAGVALLGLGPLMLIVALAIWLSSGRPLLFRQRRIGIHGQSFELLKFRTMRTQVSDDVHREYVRGWIGQRAAGAAAANGNPLYKLQHDPRVTPIGRWLRRFSIDELPQLINVLRGDMSLIGPRPALPYEVEHYQNWHRRRLDAPPGMTGLWQVSGRNRISFDDMVRLDIEYIDNWSLASDLRILARTLPAMLNGGGL